MFCTQCSRSSPEFSSHWTFLSLTSYEVLLLTTSHLTLLHCNNLNLANLLHSINNEVPHNGLTLMDHLLIPHNNLQEISLGNVTSHCSQ